MTQLEQILDLARWAPSGDNTQPWRFQILSAHHLAVHAFDTREHCVYDLDGHASQLSVGALLETMRIAATGQGLATRYRRRLDAPEARPVFDVTFDEGQAITRSPLIDAIRARTVQRRPLKRRGIRPEEKTALESSLPAGYSVIWLEGARRWDVARLLFLSAKIRLTTREAYEVHRKVLHWNAQFSEDRIPDQAVGLDPLTLRLMRWAMRDWRRVWILNTFLAGTLAPRLQLDLLPALACGAHLAILAPGEPASVDDYVTAGASVQRLWLTATSLGLQHQPEITPLIFSRYARTGRQFTENARAKQIAISVADRLEGLLGKDAARRAIWFGRLGAGQPARARSTRLPLDRLLLRG